MSEIVWKVEKKTVKELVPYEHNPRVIKDKQFNELKKSIEKFGYVDLIIVNSDMTVIGGHQRLKALMEQGKGDEVIEVRVPSKQLKESDLQELNIRLNLNKGEFDFSVLQSKAFDVDLLLNSGFEPFQIGAHNRTIDIPKAVQSLDAATTKTNSESVNLGSEEFKSIIPDDFEEVEPVSYTGSNESIDDEPERNMVTFDVLVYPEVRDILVKKLKEIKEQHGHEFLWQSFEYLVKTI